MNVRMVSFPVSMTITKKVLAFLSLELVIISMGAEKILHFRIYKMSF